MGAPVRAQRSGPDGERRRSGTSELCPAGEARDGELAPTKEQGVSRMLTINLNDVEKKLHIK